MAVAGKVAPLPRGDYSPTEIYNVLDIVNHAEKPWICKKSGIQDIEPTVLNTEEWQLLFDIDIANADTLDGFDSSYFAPLAKVTQEKHGGFLAADWVGSAAPYTQTIVVEGIKDTDKPAATFLPNEGETKEQYKGRKKSFGMISYFDSGNGTITATCLYDKPIWDFSVTFKGV